MGQGATAAMGQAVAAASCGLAGCGSAKGYDSDAPASGSFGKAGRIVTVEMEIPGMPAPSAPGTTDDCGMPPAPAASGMEPQERQNPLISRLLAEAEQQWAEQLRQVAEQRAASFGKRSPEAPEAAPQPLAQEVEAAGECARL
mmetsp:Transcript_96657/g.215396  ORF Transcript_96657/g.215396 Transcript_96657/m.215396 type:complete len:143 (-) Transcript_96657:36-464(-)